MNPEEIRTPEDVIKLFEEMGTEEVLEFRLHLDKETDRGCALMAAAFLDELLKELLQNTFVDDPDSYKDLFTGTGGLATFSSRIELSYLLGLIPPRLRRDLHIIRKIRNDFAHSMKIIDFNHPPIASRCRELHYNIFKDQIPPRKAFNRVAFGVAGVINGAKRITKRMTMHDDIDFGSVEFQKGLEPVAKLMEFFHKYKQAQQSDEE
ncbi:mannitol repressor protein [compost metagenome]